MLTVAVLTVAIVGGAGVVGLKFCFTLEVIKPITRWKEASLNRLKIRCVAIESQVYAPFVLIGQVGMAFGEICNLMHEFLLQIARHTTIGAITQLSV